jgi:hypothetical protein
MQHSAIGRQLFVLKPSSILAIWVCKDGVAGDGAGAVALGDVEYRCAMKLTAEAGSCSYRFETPRAAFFSFFLLEPRGSVRFALGAAFLRATRFTFLRSSLSSIFFVSANV